MRKFCLLVAALVVLLWPAMALAVVVETEVTTAAGEAIAGAEIVLETPAGQPVKTATAKPVTNDSGKVELDVADEHVGVPLVMIVRRGGVEIGRRNVTLRPGLNRISMGSPVPAFALVPTVAGPILFPNGPYWGIGLGGHRTSGTKHHVGGNTLDATGTRFALEAFMGMCGMWGALCLEANLASGASGHSSVGANEMTRRKIAIIGFDVSRPYPLQGTPYYFRPIVGLNMDLIETELGGNRARGWMPTWHVGLAIGGPMPTAFGPMWGEIVYRYSQTFGSQDLVFDRISHVNQSIMFRMVMPLNTFASAANH